MRYIYKPQGVCTHTITLELEDGVIRSALFEGGCSGNTQGVAALVAGRRADEVIAQLRGIRCGSRPTSCPDQFSLALEQALLSERNG